MDNNYNEFNSVYKQNILEYNLSLLKYNHPKYFKY